MNMTEKILSHPNLALTHLDLSGNEFYSEKLMKVILPSMEPTLLTLSLESTATWWNTSLSYEEQNESKEP